MSDHVEDDRAARPFIVDPTSRFEEVRGALEGAERVRGALGSLLVEGWVGLASGLRAMPLELLVTPPGLETTEQLAERLTGDALRADLARRESMSATSRDRAVTDTRLAVRRGLAELDQGGRTADSIRAAERALAEGRHAVRLHLAGGLSARSLSFVGTERALISSDNPLLGYMEPGDLGLPLEGAAAKAIDDRFGRLWSAARSVDDVLLEELRACWAMQSLTPYEAFVLVLYHLLAGAEASDEELLLQDEPIFAQLAPFQVDAVRSALSILRKQQGCFVSDVVGLGKSMIGCALIKYFERVEGVRALIVCPAVLTDMWERYIDEFELSARVVSSGLLQEDSRLASAFERRTPELSDRELVLVDESHMFRNAGTQRFRYLESFIGDDRRVVLLSATPMNRSPRDVYNQIRLFHQRDVTSLPITPPHLDRFFSLVEKGGAELPELLRHLVIRRTRRDIIRRYGRDSETNKRVAAEDLSDYMAGRRKAYFSLGGEQRSFPTRELTTVSYSIEDAYNGIYRTLVSRIGQREIESGDGLRHTRYRRLEYVLPEFASEYAHLRGTQGSLASLMRALLFKRLESSVFSFAATIERMMKATMDEHHLALGSTNVSDVRASDGLEGDAHGSGGELEMREVKMHHLDRQRYAQDLAHDIGALAGIRSLVEVIRPESDAKLQALLELLRSAELQEEKVLVFTQFAETARYLHEHLSTAFGANDVGLCWSQGAGRGEILARFAPRANPHVSRRAEERELRLLVATDVLSEGVNLQDARIVVNYDLHWNPVRLIQRLGRVDRIGSEHDRIGAFNFLPEVRLEEQLGLRERLANRISEIHEVIGEDTAILDPSEQLNEHAMYAIYSGSADIGEFERNLESGRQDLGLEEAEALIAELGDERADWLGSLVDRPPGLRAARFTHGPEGVVAVLRSREETRIFWCSRDGAAEESSLTHLLPRISCTEGESGTELPSWGGDLVEQCRAAMRADLERRESARQTGARYPKAQREVLDRLRECEAIEPREEVARRIDRLIHAFDQDLVSAPRRALRAIGRRGLDADGFLNELSRIALDYGLVENDYAALTGTSAVAVDVVVSMALVREGS